MADWAQFYSEERSVYVTILRKKCAEEDYRQGKKGSWVAVEYQLPESEWTVVIKYAYEKTDEEKAWSEAHATAMKNLKPLGHFKRTHEPG